MKIIHVWSGKAKDDATAARMAMAKLTWDREATMYGDWASIQHEAGERNGTTVGDPVPLPFIHDMINSVLDRAGDKDIILVTNADIGLYRGFAMELSLKVEEHNAVFCQRWDFPSLAQPVQTKSEIRSGNRYPGCDAFGFTKEWWLKNRDDIPPFLLGRECWDWVFREKIKETGGVEMQAAIFHQLHDSDWKKGRRKQPGNIYNRSYARAWLTLRKMDLREIANAPFNEVAWPPVKWVAKAPAKSAGTMDVLIVLGRGSKWENNELRYCLRALERHAKGMGNVFVVGQNPGFLSDKVTMLAREDYGKNKEHNIAEQIQFAAANLPMTEHFLWVNDDCFFTEDVDITKYPYYADGSLEHKWSKTAKNGYRVALMQTDAQLRARNLPTTNYEQHTPIIYSRAGFAKLKFWVELSAKVPYGMTFRSVYCNVLGITPGPSYRDLKIGSGDSVEEFRAKIAGRHVFSIGDGLGPAVKEYFNELYPNKSIYEQ